jgi:hypothetical protein
MERRRSQQEWCRGPEQAERGTQGGLIERASSQDWCGRRHLGHRDNQFAVAKLRRRESLRQRVAEHQCEHHHRSGGYEEHGVPRDQRGNEAGHRTGQHDAEQKPAHDRANDPTAQCFGRQMRSQRNQHLRSHRAEADEERRHEEEHRVRSTGLQQGARERRPRVG